MKDKYTDMKPILNFLKYTFLICAIVYFILVIIIFIKNPDYEFITSIEKIGPGFWMLLASLGFHYLKNNPEKFFGEQSE